MTMYFCKHDKLMGAGCAACAAEKRSRLSEDYLRKAIASAPLLPPPGDGEVKKFAEECLRLSARERELVGAARVLLAELDYQAPNGLTRKELPLRNKLRAALDEMELRSKAGTA
jgi:hypothetical protein